MPNKKTPLYNLLLFGLLLFFTPFLLLMNYLQSAIIIFSELSLKIENANIPYVVIAAVVFLVTIIILYGKRLNNSKAIAIVLILLMYIYAYRVTDYYLQAPVYHLQTNWHYIAYFIYAYIAYRYFSLKSDKPGRVIFSIFISALVICSVDEALQLAVSNRVFDISDISKDLWGTIMGIIFTYFILLDGNIILGELRIREKKLKDFYNNPFGVLFWIFIFTLIFLPVSSFLSDSIYLVTSIFITLAVFLLIYILVKIGRTKTGKTSVLVVVGLLIIILGQSVVRNYNKGVRQLKPGIVLYKGIPIPYFDLFIFENGCFRLMDKKIYFNHVDIRCLFSKSSSILVIGTGEERVPAIGFPQTNESQFTYNSSTEKMLQVVTLSTKEAIREYNRLKKEGKKVTLLIHNSKQ